MSRFSEEMEAVPAEDRAIASLAAWRFFNCVGGMRPSDAARSIVREYQADPVGFVRRETELREEEAAAR